MYMCINNVISETLKLCLRVVHVHCSDNVQDQFNIHTSKNDYVHVGRHLYIQDIYQGTPTRTLSYQ